MQFTYPYFLFALFTILIVIAIHLFNFRRFKVEYFSNVKLLQDILLKTKKESQLKKLIVLLLRILAITCLVFAFAQPYIPRKNQKSESGNLITVFVDNSFSMEANSTSGSLIKESVDAAKKIVDAFSYNDEFLLITHDFLPQHTHISNKEEILTQLDEIQITPQSRTLQEILLFKENAAFNSKMKNEIVYYISDFQKNQFDFSALLRDTLSSNFLVPITAAQVNNIAIDSCWFSAPVFKKGYNVLLNVRVQNYGETDVVKLPLKLYVNGAQKGLTALDIKAKSYADAQISYTINEQGTQTAYLEINDAPINYDDRLYFTYPVFDQSSIISISGGKPNRYIDALYGKDSLFQLTVMPVAQIDYSLFPETALLILDQVESFSSGLQDQLVKYLEGGAQILLFPPDTLDRTSWNQFLSSVQLPAIESLVKQPLKMGEINYESPYYKDALEREEEQIEKPTILQYYRFGSVQRSMELIVNLENGEPLLSYFPVGTGGVFLSAVALNDLFGNAHKHALFFIPLHNIAIQSQVQPQLYYTIGKDQHVLVPRKQTQRDEVASLKSRNNGEQFIPEQQNRGNDLAVSFHNQITTPGFYDLTFGDDTLSTWAMNFNRRESQLEYFSKKDLENITKNSTAKVEILNFQVKDLTKSVADKLTGIALWRYFIMLALFFFLAEVLVLRLWGRAKY